MKPIAKSLKEHLLKAAMSQQPLGQWVQQNVKVKGEKQVLLGLLNQDRRRSSKYNREQTLWWLLEIVMPRLGEYEVSASSLSRAYVIMNSLRQVVDNKRNKDSLRQLGEYKKYRDAVIRYGELKAETARKKDSYHKARVPPELRLLQERISRATEKRVPPLRLSSNLNSRGWKARIRSIHGEAVQFTQVTVLIGRWQKPLEWVAKNNQQEVIGVYKPREQTCWINEYGEHREYKGSTGIHILRGDQLRHLKEQPTDQEPPFPLSDAHQTTGQLESHEHQSEKA